MNDTYEFAPTSKSSENVQTINFVHITRKENKQEDGNSTVYRVNYVVDGIGTVRCGQVTQEVKKGDIFFLLPEISYAITGNEAFEYMYISYNGTRATAEMEKRNISEQNFVFREFWEIYPLWMQGIGYHLDGIELISESVFLYTLAKISERTGDKPKKGKQSDSAANVRLIKNYIDKNFADLQLSVDQMSIFFAYNKKYLSTLFKKYYKIGVTDYINILRINYACALIEQGNKSVTEIAFLCGFNDSLYFSKVFKKKIGISPSKYICKGGTNEV